MAELIVLKCGAHGSVQDSGRPGYRHWGIPLSGALDEESMSLANLICGNDEKQAVLELIGPGWELQFDGDTMIAICGADCHAVCNNQPLEINKKHLLSKGSILKLPSVSRQRISYVAIQGGFLSETVLGSRSWHPHLTASFLLKKNMILPYSDFYRLAVSAQISVNQTPVHAEIFHIQAVPGPEWSQLSEVAVAMLIKQVWTLSANSNRMAYLLNEKLPPHKSAFLTSAVWPGIVQLTPSGQMIILMKDAQTTGGYPRILSMAQHELNLLAQLNPGTKIKWNISKY